MKNLDFLPDIYRQRAAHSRARAWWIVVVAIFGVAIGTTATLQMARRAVARRQLEALTPQCVAAETLAQQLLAVQAQTDEQSHAAALVTYLQHPWPRSQILAALVEPLPEAIRLTEVRLGEEEISRPLTGEQLRPEVTTTEAAKKLSPAQADLQRLRERDEARRVVVDLVGLADDVAELHRYVDRVSHCPLFASAQMKSLATTGTTEQTAQAGQAGQHRFELQLVLSAGHGRFDAKTKPAAAPPGALTLNAAQPASRAGADR